MEKAACEANALMSYTWESRECVEKCGDGVDMLTYECDDGNLVSGDGCNETCQVEPGFYC